MITFLLAATLLVPISSANAAAKPRPVPDFDVASLVGAYDGVSCTRSGLVAPEKPAPIEIRQIDKSMLVVLTDVSAEHPAQARPLELFVAINQGKTRKRTTSDDGSCGQEKQETFSTAAGLYSSRGYVSFLKCEGMPTFASRQSAELRRDGDQLLYLRSDAGVTRVCAYKRT